MNESNMDFSPKKTSNSFTNFSFIKNNFSPSLRVSPSEPQPNNNHKQMMQRLMELEGECKIESFQFLKFNITKTILLMILIIITVFGLFFLKYFKAFRVLVFYDKAKIQSATHLYIKNNERSDDIVEIIASPPSDDQKEVQFFYNKLKYVLEEGKAIPIGFKYQEHFSFFFNSQFQEEGLSNGDVTKLKQIYGKNEHKVEIQSFFAYLFETMTTILFLLQYVFCVIFFIEGYAPFSIAILFFSILSTAVNYLLLYLSYRRIKEMAERQIRVKVLRNRTVQEINCNQLVPGDIFFPQEQVPCDALVLSGDIYVNEANLTGESYPIGKFPVLDLQSTRNNHTWLNEGSKILEAREYSKAIVINTGFHTFRGRIIRKILAKERKEPDLFRSVIFFVLEVVVVSIIGFFACLPFLLSLDIEPTFIAFKFFDFLASAAPPPLPIFINVAYSFSLARLRVNSIFGTEPQQTVNGAYVKTLCFDKTGTLTQKQVQIKKIFKVNEKERKFDKIEPQKLKQTNKQIDLLTKLFACCHTVKYINEEYLGDEIDKQMFFKCQYKMRLSKNKGIRFIVEKQIEKLEILRINQFESKFQSMSVLVKDVPNSKYYIFIKGAPEKIYSNSINQNEEYNKIVSELCLSGFRTIGFGYREIQEKDIEPILVANRQRYEETITLLGLVGFDNKLKEDAFETMQQLHISNIEPKMITGDNIFIGIQTGVRCGILKREEPIILLQGRKQTFNSEEKRTFKGVLLKRNLNQEVQEEQVLLEEDESYLQQNYPIAIDGDFLNLEPAPYLPNKIAIFARIKPEDKARIIIKLKAKIRDKLQQTQSKFSQLLKINKLKVGMCGDGANDLLALREADLSLGIEESDSSYGSSFTIGKLQDANAIIRQSKNTQANIIQLTQYYMITAFFNLLSSIIMISDATYYSTATLMYINFTSLLIFPFTFTFSRPTRESTNYVPDSNFMGLHNQLVYWGNVIINTCSVIAGYFYYYNSDEFEPNPEPIITIQTGFNSQNHTATVIFLLVLLPFAFNAFFLYKSKPWKEIVFTNYLFILVLVINIVPAILFFFNTASMVQLLEIVQVSRDKAGVMLGIVFGFVFVSFLYNQIIRCLKLDHKVLEMDFDDVEMQESRKRVHPEIGE